MSKDERQEFLAGVHVGVLSIPEEGRGPLSAPIWYDYEPGGEFWVMLDPSSRKGRLLAVGTRLSLVAQTEAPPYGYVSVEGPVTSIGPADTERHLRPMARRYLGPEMGDRYTEGAAGGGGLIVRARPERWLSVDYAKADLAGVGGG